VLDEAVTCGLEASRTDYDGPAVVAALGIGNALAVCYKRYPRELVLAWLSLAVGFAYDYVLRVIPERHLVPYFLAFQECWVLGR